jgi:hypothetical protein
MSLCLKLIVLCFAFSTAAMIECVGFGQEADETVETESREPKKKKRKKKHKTKKSKHHPTKPANEASDERGETSVADESEAPLQTELKAPKKEQEPEAPVSEHAWFPVWQPDRFDWMLQPIIAFKYTQGVNETTGTTRTSTAEGGLAAGLRGIPVVFGNPGYTIGPRAGVAWGYSNSIVKADGLSAKTQGSHYRRQWAGIDNTVYIKSFRYALNLTRGELLVSEDKDRRIQSFRADNDFGMLLRSWWSVHYSLNHARAYNSGFATPFLVENDHWLHTRFTIDLLEFVFDLGPGFTDVIAWDFQGKEKTGSGSVNYFLLKTRFNPFWKLVGEGVGKYAIDASQKRLGLYANERLPEDDLDEPSSLAMPEDSFLGSMFFGVKDLFFGVGVGWRYNIQILNLAKKGDTERETTRDHGLGLYYDVRL